MPDPAKPMSHEITEKTHLVRHIDIPQVKMFNPNFNKNKPYDMNCVHKNMSYIPL